MGKTTEKRAESPEAAHIEPIPEVGAPAVELREPVEQPEPELYREAPEEGADYCLETEHSDRPTMEIVLPYEPFDAKEELGRVRQFSPEEAAWSPEQRRNLVRRRLDSIRENLGYQQRGLAWLIADLRAELDGHPDMDVDDLLDRAEHAARLFRFSRPQLDMVRHAIMQFDGQRAAVRECRERYPDDKQLFEACFGRKPTGAVEVARMPMSLHVKCHDTEDYVWAYTDERRRAGVVDDAEGEKLARASAGFAARTVRVPELADAITVADMQQSSSWEVAARQVVEDVGAEPLRLKLDVQKEDIEIVAPAGRGRWTVHATKRFACGFPEQLAVSAADAAEPLTVVDRSMEPGGTWKLRQGDEAPDRVTTRLAAGDGTDCGTLEIDGPDLIVSGAGLTVSHRQWSMREDPLSERRIQATARHEEQHQFNKLFVPLEMRLSLNKISAAIAESAGTGNERLAATRWLARWHRHDMIDGRTRDEIIAYYHEGHAADAIEGMLDSELYDYAKMGFLKTRMEHLPGDIVESIEDEVGGGAPGIDEKVAAQVVTEVFGEEYKQDIRRWLGAIAKLEAKGYGRPEIVGLLTQEPANGWNALAQRLPVKEGLV